MRRFINRADDTLDHPDTLIQAVQKVQMQGAWTAIVSVKRGREDRASTTTLHEHEFRRGDRAHPSTVLRAIGKRQIQVLAE